jgi:uncharacterized PurR-regulated membrane protein YhhQ (DUF165 family)
MEQESGLMVQSEPLLHGTDTKRKPHWYGYSLVAGYLLAIVLANLLVAWFGPAISIVNAFVFVGLALTTRDALHDLWRDHLVRNMTLLVLAGSALSWLMGAGQIAIASAVAFAASETVDAVTYALLGKQSKLLRINGSNVVSAAVDSLVFPILAFGFPVLWDIVLGQFIAKVAGGFVWSLLLNKQQEA